MEVLLESRCEELYQDSLRERVMVHGEYNYHNILICTDGIATTNFEKFRIHVQMEDFYYFLRKTMEKHEWDARLFDHMMNAYSAICPVTDREMEYLKARFIYPEKILEDCRIILQIQQSMDICKECRKVPDVCITNERKGKTTGRNIRFSQVVENSINPME